MFPGKFNSQYSLVKLLRLNLKVLWKEQFSKISTSKGYRTGETFHNHHTIGTSEERKTFILEETTSILKSIWLKYKMVLISFESWINL